MTAPPSRAILAGSPDHATAKAWYLQLVDFLYDRLGGGAGAANSAEQDVSCAYLGAVRTTQLYGQRSRLINGGFQINQRGLTSVGDDVYCLDRWYALTEGGNVTVAPQVDQEVGTPNSVRLTQPDASPKRIGIAQIIAAGNCKDLRNRITTLAGRLRCSASTQINYAVLEWTGTTNAVTSDFISAWGGSPTYVANITERAKGTLTPGVSVWTDMPALNAVINSGVNNVIIFVWSNAALAQGTTLDLSRMQYEPGSYATPFEFLDEGAVLARCKDYWRTGTLDVDGAAGLKYASGSGANFHNTSHSFGTGMRATPTLGINGTITYENCSAITFLPGPTGFSTRVTVTAAGLYRAYNAIWVADAEL